MDIYKLVIGGKNITYTKTRKEKCCIALSNYTSGLSKVEIETLVEMITTDLSYQASIEIHTKSDSYIKEAVVTLESTYISVYDIERSYSALYKSEASTNDLESDEVLMLIRDVSEIKPTVTKLPNPDEVRELPSEIVGYTKLRRFYESNANAMVDAYFDMYIITETWINHCKQLKDKENEIED